MYTANIVHIVNDVQSKILKHEQQYERSDNLGIFLTSNSRKFTKCKQ